MGACSGVAGWLTRGRGKEEGAAGTACNQQRQRPCVGTLGGGTWGVHSQAAHALLMWPPARLCPPCPSRDTPASVPPCLRLCRWQLPGLLATAATLLAHTRTFCGNSLLQHGYATLHTLLRLLLPLASPALVSLAPPLTRAPEASAGGAALCAAYHVPSVMLGCAALAAHLYAAEAQQRKAFLAARRDRRRSSGSGSSAVRPHSTHEQRAGSQPLRP